MPAPIRSVFIAIALIALAASGSAPAARATAPFTVEYRNGRWFDGTGFQPGTWYAVGGVLTRQRPPRIDERHDLRGRYALPPLAEAHNHNLQNPWGVRTFLDRYRAEGVQYAAMLCGDADAAQAARQALGTNAPIDVLQASACISSSDGHPLAMAQRNADGTRRPAAEVHDRAYIVMDTVADIERKWPLVRAAQPDLVKAILVHGERRERRTDARFHGYNGLAPELLAPLVRKAHGDGLRVVAHVESAADFGTAVAAGVDLIAHLPGYQFWDGCDERDYRLDDAAIALAAQRRIPVIATASAAALLAGKDAARLARIQALQQENLRRLIAAGVPIAIGSDRFDATSRVELDYLAELQVMPMPQLLRAAVELTPTLLFPQRRIGRIAEGHEASFLVLDADPTRDPAALQRIQLKVRQGRVY